MTTDHVNFPESIAHDETVPLTAPPTLRVVEITPPSISELLSDQNSALTIIRFDRELTEYERVTCQGLDIQIATTSAIAMLIPEKDFGQSIRNSIATISAMSLKLMRNVRNELSWMRDECEAAKEFLKQENLMD